MVLDMTNGTSSDGGGAEGVCTTGVLAGQEVTCFHETRKYTPSLFNPISVFTTIFPSSIPLLTSHVLLVPISLVLHVTDTVLQAFEFPVVRETYLSLTLLDLITLM
jgi:hypothetical protein